MKNIIILCLFFGINTINTTCSATEEFEQEHQARSKLIRQQSIERKNRETQRINDYVENTQQQLEEEKRKGEERQEENNTLKELLDDAIQKKEEITHAEKTLREQANKAIHKLQEESHICKKENLHLTELLQGEQKEKEQYKAKIQRLIDELQTQQDIHIQNIHDNRRNLISVLLNDGLLTESNYSQIIQAISLSESAWSQMLSNYLMSNHNNNCYEDLEISQSFPGKSKEEIDESGHTTQNVSLNSSREPTQHESIYDDR